MAAQALYRKWRSQVFDEVIGQEHVTLTLRNALREGRMSHAYLFTGPRGTGKTSTARILAKAINCLAENLSDRPDNSCRLCVSISEGRQLDLIEIDAASNRGIDEIRELRERIGFSPNEARYKVYIIDEAHMLTKEAFNALLKTLEEPPEHAVFVLATTEPDRVPETVRSRCQRFDFRRIPTDEIVQHLESVLQQEGRQAAPEALVAIARRATGSMRDAISLLDQLLSYDEEVLDLARVERVLGLVDTSAVARLVDCMATNNSAGGLTLINGMVSDGMELSQLVDQIIAYLRGVLFLRITQSKESLDVSEDIRAIMVQQASGLEVRDVLGAIRVFLDARSELRDQVPGVPQLPVELAFLRALPQRREGEAPGPNPVSVAPQTAFQSTPAPVTQQPAQVATPALRSPQVTASAAKTAPSAADNGEEALLERARAGWDPFLDLAGKRCGVKLQAALRSVRTLDLSGETLVLRFSHAFAQEMVNQPQYRSQLESVWEEVLGRPIRLRCALQSENVDPAPSHKTAAAMAEDNDLLLQEARNMGAVVKPLKTER